MRAVTGINVVVWSALLWLGWRSLAVHPTQEHVAYYLYFPISMVGATLAAHFLGGLKGLRLVALAAETLVLLAVVPFLLSYTGGV